MIQKNHYEDVMKDPDGQKYECKACGRSYVDEAYYNSHVRVNIGMKKDVMCMDNNFLHLFVETSSQGRRKIYMSNM